jgi:hypothetical protein
MTSRMLYIACATLVFTMAVSVLLALHVTQRAQAQEVGEPRLQRLVGSWVIVSSTFGGVTDGQLPTFVGAPGAAGRAVTSVWKQGSGSTSYEANALWGFDGATKQVRVFEVNTLGVAEMHVGKFDDQGSLVLELREPKTNTLIQSRRFTWSGDTMRMGASFYANEAETKHLVTLVRR